MRLMRFPCKSAPSAAFNHPRVCNWQAVTRYALMRRHRLQMLERPHGQRAALAHLAACAVLPLDGRLTFDHPIVPFGQVVLQVLSHTPARLPDGRPRYVAYVRGYFAWIDRRRARTHWDAQGHVLACDFARPIFDRRLDRLCDKDLAMARTALDMDRELMRVAPRPWLIRGQPCLPPTLLAYPRGTQLIPEATPWVLARAQKDNIPWEEAWHLVVRESAVPESLNPSPYLLIDTRLSTRAWQSPDKPGAVTEFHDLRGYLGRRTLNPCSGRHPDGISEEQLLASMRRRMPQDLARIAKDQDLLQAAQNGDASILIRNLSKIHVWWPPMAGNSADAFVGETSSQRSDLWRTRPEVIQELGLVESRDTFPSSSAQAVASAA